MVARRSETRVDDRNQSRWRDGLGDHVVEADAGVSRRFELRKMRRERQHANGLAPWQRAQALHQIEAIDIRQEQILDDQARLVSGH